MQKLFFALLSATLIALGSASAMANEAPALSDEAKQALSKAEADVKEAQSKKALWTTAQDALKKAKEAADKGDNARVIAASKKASDQAQLGIKQLSYPPTNK
jgi:hypothetical protein